jgi:RhtX/FptX family siderophore transporter
MAAKGLGMAQRTILMIAGLYFVQGLPIGLAFQAYPVWLRAGGAPLDLIALVPLAGLPWVLKPCWATLVDNFWHAGLGRRRSWILPMQAIIALTLAGIALVPFTADGAGPLLALVGLCSLSSATQDIATDGLAAETLHGRDVAHANTLQVACIMLGMLVGGPGAMVGFDVFGQTATCLMLAALVAACALPVVAWNEAAPQGSDTPRAAWRHFFRRPGVLGMLLLGMLTTAAGAIVFGLVQLILVDAGWSMADVGLVAGVGNSLMVVAGCGIAAILLRLGGDMTTLGIGLGIVAAAALGWIGAGGAPLPVLAWALAALGGIGIGVASAAIYTILMRFAKAGRQPGTDFAAFQGVQILGEIVASSAATALAARAGYPAALGLAVGAAAAAGLVAWIGRR